MHSDVSCLPRHKMSFQAEITLSEVKVEVVCKHLAALSKAGKQDDVILVLQVTGIPQWTWNVPTVICLLHKHALLINSNGKIKASLFSVGIFTAPVTTLSRLFTTFIVSPPQLFRQDIRVISVRPLGKLNCTETHTEDPRGNNQRRKQGIEIRCLLTTELPYLRQILNKSHSTSWIPQDTNVTTGLQEASPALLKCFLEAEGKC